MSPPRGQKVVQHMSLKNWDKENRGHFGFQVAILWDEQEPIFGVIVTQLSSVYLRNKFLLQIPFRSPEKVQMFFCNFDMMEHWLHVSHDCQKKCQNSNKELVRFDPGRSWLFSETSVPQSNTTWSAPWWGRYQIFPSERSNWCSVIFSAYALSMKSVRMNILCENFHPSEISFSVHWHTV